MGARIEAFATSTGRRWPFATGALKLADTAAAACLLRAHRSAAEVDLLVNAGVYRDDNLGEPALAALIQEDIGANPRQRPGAAHGTFSFDVANGGAGVITAMYLVDGFLADSIDLGLVVASDADTGSPVLPEFPFAPVGGALLLAPGDADEGFAGFQLDTYPDVGPGLTSEVRWQDRSRRRGQNVLVIDEQPGYAARCIECAVASIRRFLDRFQLESRDVDLIVPSQQPGNFPDALGERLDLPGDRITRVAEELGRVHTAGPIAALEAAERDGRFRRARNVLFVGVGAGVSVGQALYRRQSRPGGW